MPVAVVGNRRFMDHDQYIDKYLSAQADGELSSEELALVNEHLRGCSSCSAMLAAERKLKARLRRHLHPQAAPADLRASIESAIKPLSARPVPAIPRHARRWIPLAAGAVLALAALLVVAVNRERPSNPVLEMAAAGYHHESTNFIPNVPDQSPTALAAELSRQTGYPITLWNFSRSGLKLVGSRLERKPDGRFIIYTLYRGPTGSILCMFTPRAGLNPPAPGLGMDGGAHQLYTYRGLSMAMTRAGPLLCLLVTRMPVGKLMAAIQAAES